MSVSTHLAIELGEYDARIRTFIPDYEEMLDVVTHVLRLHDVRHVVDLGTGTGALAQRIARALPNAVITGVDADEGMLRMAARRFRRRHVTLMHGSFISATLPRCDAMTASFALHHVERPATKRQLFRRVFAALRPGGLLVSADCHPATDTSLAKRGRNLWRQHLSVEYGRTRAEKFLEAWAHEDFYTTLDTEQRLLRAAGFATEVVWRRNAFAVIAATRPARQRTTKAERPVSATGRPSRSAVTDQK